MPQEKRRSIRYRTFLACDNPESVVECRAIRKSNKTNSSQIKEQENKAIIIKKEKKEMGIRAFTRELVDTSPSFQLQQNPKGGNHVTNSWSNNGHKHDIAQDLLKGVLDLRESLVILSKLEETSRRKHKHKHKEKLEEVGRFDDMGNGVMDSNRFGYFHDEERPRVSVVGSSRKAVDGVKNVVRESLLRQNVSKNVTFEDFPHRKMGASNSPSTSSSNFSLSDPSVSSTATQRRKKGKGLNLIVKLMGLESLPASPRSFKKGKEVLNLARPMYDHLKSPTKRKSQYAPQEMGTKQRAFDEILESLNFKGLLRSNSAKGLAPDSRNFEDYPLFDERPPIVVMKPLQFWGDSFARNEENLRETKSRRGNHEPANFRDKFREVIARESCERKRVSAKKAGVDTRKTYQNDRLFYSKNQIRCQEKIFSTSISDYRIVKNSESSRQQKKNRQSVSMMRVENQRRKGRVMGSERHYREEIDSNSENEYAFPTFDSMLISNLDTERWNQHSRAMIPDYDADSQSSFSDTRDSIEYFNNDSKNSLRVSLVGTLENACEYHPDDNQSLLSEITSKSISEHCSFITHLDENLSPLSEVTSVTSTHEIGITVPLDTNEQENEVLSENYDPCEEFIEEETDDDSSIKCLTPRAKLKAFLLSSPSFANRAEELFNLQVNSSLIPHINDPSDLEFSSPKVLVDYAIELMEVRSSQLSQVSLPRFLTTGTRHYPSLSEILEEICKGIEDLRGYINLANKGFSSDHLYALLYRDLRYKSEVWDIGWRNAFSMDEVEQVVGEVDKFVLGNLIEEVLADFLL